MRTYTVHRPRRAAGNPELEAEQTLFVREGFCWPALFVPFLWFIYHRMWLVLTGYIATMVLLSTGPALLGVSSLIGGALSVIIQIVLAAEANDLRRWTLARSGFEFVDVVHGRRLFVAETDYFTGWTQNTAAAEQDIVDNEAQVNFRLDPTPTTTNPA